MSWINGVRFFDGLVKDYLLKRGFYNALKSFDSDLKADKDKGFRIDKIVQYIHSCINNYDIDALRAYWSHLESRIFCRFDPKYEATVRKMQTSLFRLYVVTCMQNGKRKECMDFYEKMTPELHGVPEWKEWFAMPFLSHPESSKPFAMYFQKQWSDTFMVSLYNFLSVSFAALNPPDLLKELNKDKQMIQKLKTENETLKKKLAGLNDEETKPQEPASYVKYLGTPGVFQAPKPEPVPQQKKKLPFSFPSLKSNSNKQKAQQAIPKTASKPQPNEEPANQTGAVGKQAQKGSPTMSRSISTKASATTNDASRNLSSSNEGQSFRSKKLSGYQLQRKELFGDKSSSKSSKSAVSVDGEVVGSNTAIHSARQSSTKVNQQQFSDSPPVTISKDTLSLATAGSAIDTGNNLPIIESMHSGASIVSGSNQVTMEIPGTDRGLDLNVWTSASVHQYDEHRSVIVQCRSSFNGLTCASCDADGVVKIWQKDSEDELRTLATIMSRSSFQSLEWSRMNENLLILGSSNGLLRLYDAASKQTVQDINTNQHSAISQIKFQPNNNSFTISCSNPDLDTVATPASKLLVWNASETQVVLAKSVQADDARVECICFNPQGSLLACGDSKGNVSLYNTANFKAIVRRKLHQTSVCTMQFSDDGFHVYSIATDGSLVVWNISTQSKVTDLPIHPQAAGPFEVSGFGGYKQVHQPRGGQLFTVSGNQILTCDRNTAVLYRIEPRNSSLQKLLLLTGHRAPVLCLEWVSTSEPLLCASGSMDGKVRLTQLHRQAVYS